MSELSCDTLFIGRNETHDLSRYLLRPDGVEHNIHNTQHRICRLEPGPGLVTDVRRASCVDALMTHRTVPHRASVAAASASTLTRLACHSWLAHKSKCESSHLV